VESIVKRYGEDTLVRLIEAFNRHDAPDDLHGMELWRDIFQACEVDFDEVINEFYRSVEQDLETHRTDINALPRLYAEVNIIPKQILLTVDAPDTNAISCTVRRSDIEDELFHFQAFRNDAGRFVIHQSDLGTRSFWYRLAWYDKASGNTYSEPWKRVAF
ncbi:MAG: hypothetical protein AAF492_20880, partial [Verrucomicrobiota bacterium]